jgi:hypothetical protein
MGIMGEKEKCNQFSLHERKKSLAELDRGIKQRRCCKKTGANFLQVRRQIRRVDSGAV